MAPAPDAAALAVSGLRFAYRRGGEELFAGLSHEFATGAVTAVTGPSGRGKSTLLYVLGLMLRPTAGQVLVGGARVDDRPDVQRSWIRATRIGFVFQDAVLDPARTVLDSVIEPALYGGARRADVRARARDLLDGLGVGERADHKPGQVSGGQAQRVAVARALLPDPALVLADEPTGNLDSKSATEIGDLLRQVSTEWGRSVLMVTHDPRIASFAERLVLMRDGRIVDDLALDGTHEAPRLALEKAGLL